MWKEVNLAQARREGVHLARRESGGGCVYHVRTSKQDFNTYQEDGGNINITFFTESHHPFDNLHIIQRALGSLGMNVDTSARHELLMDGKKVF